MSRGAVLDTMPVRSVILRGCAEIEFTTEAQGGRARNQTGASVGRYAP
jgi:hypothetical protein